MLICVTLHNMTIEEQQNEFGEEQVEMIEYETNPYFTLDPPDHDTLTLVEYMIRHNRIRNRERHHALKADFVKHLWIREGGGE
ncbi:unnamed protein product [Linum trigynum]|uniref:Uncharacterized protein n=1 Tax=Linum trigynum TaxID=586398 RepID=A0AAV2E179_9ROSI